MKRLTAALLIALVFSSASFAYAASWQQDANGWWYKENNGSYPAAAWKKISNVWYYFDAGGYMATGWRTLSGQTYHLNASGAMDTGWKSIDGCWYYFNKSGQLVRNSWIDNAYYVGSDGVMLANTITPDGYYVGSDGKYAPRVSMSSGGRGYYGPGYTGTAHYVGNLNSMIFHYTDCRTTRNMSAYNKVDFWTRGEALSNGFQPCGVCHP